MHLVHFIPCWLKQAEIMTQCKNNVTQHNIRYLCVINSIKKKLVSHINTWLNSRQDWACVEEFKNHSAYGVTLDLLSVCKHARVRVALEVWTGRSNQQKCRHAGYLCTGRIIIRKKSVQHNPKKKALALCLLLFGCSPLAAAVFLLSS